ncbi:MAG: transposase [Marmoricola sp.]|nr:transposase [Marmoricola sp.]
MSPSRTSCHPRRLRRLRRTLHDLDVVGGEDGVECLGAAAVAVAYQVAEAADPFAEVGQEVPGELDGPGRGGVGGDAGQDEQYPVVKHGHPKDRRVDLKQVQSGLAMSADGAIPVHARVFGGGAAEVSQVVGAMKDLQAMAGEQKFCWSPTPSRCPTRTSPRCWPPGCRSSRRSLPRRSGMRSTQP